jgi:ankyrin repeat protein
VGSVRLASILKTCGGLSALQVVTALLESGVASDARDLDHSTALLLAADAGATEAVKVLVAAGADVSAADRVGVTPLIAAAYNARAACVDVLLAAGASPHHIPDNRGSMGTAAGAMGATMGASAVTALVAAAEGGDDVCVAKLLAAGAPPNQTTAELKTPLMHAAGRPAPFAAAIVTALVKAVCTPCYPLFRLLRLTVFLLPPSGERRH